MGCGCGPARCSHPRGETARGVAAATPGRGGCTLRAGPGRPAGGGGVGSGEGPPGLSPCRHRIFSMGLPAGRNGFCQSKRAANSTASAGVVQCFGRVSPHPRRGRRLSGRAGERGCGRVLCRSAADAGSSGSNVMRGEREGSSCTCWLRRSPVPGAGPNEWVRNPCRPWTAKPSTKSSHLPLGNPHQPRTLGRCLPGVDIAEHLFV